MDVGSRGRARFEGGTWGKEVGTPGTKRSWAVEAWTVNHRKKSCGVRGARWL